MGETGIGKTSLIRLLSHITNDPIRIINIHAGVTSEDIVKELMAIE
jgi:MoxR-like ATPase